MSTPDFSMLDLYQQEVETQGGALNSGLLALESNPGEAEVIDGLMRAAHSLKGAARIIGLDVVSSVAHALEDVFVEVGKGQLTLPEGSYDLMLQVADFLNTSGHPAADEMPGWLQDNQALSDNLTANLRDILAGKGAPAAAPPQAEPEPASSPEAPPPAEVSSVEKKSSEPSAQEPPKANGKSPAGGDQVVRVAAESLNRLMGLAAETLVETRQLEQFRDSLLRLKEAQNELNANIDQGQRLLESGGERNDFIQHWEMLRAAASDNLRAIRHQLDLFDTFSRRNTLLSDRLYREVLESRMRPFADGVQGFPRLVRDLAKTFGKKIRFTVDGKETPVDRDILEKLEAPLNHILRNGCDHGLEMPEERTAAGKTPGGQLRLLARHSAGMLIVEVRDDGRGIDTARLREKIVEKELTTADMAQNLSDDEVLEFLFLPGFSTAGKVTEISGRGVGLDVVMTLMQEIGGQVRITTELGKGTTFHLQLPITRSVIRVLLVEIDGEPYAFPLSRINRTIQLSMQELKLIENSQYFELEGQNVGLVSSRAALGLAGA
ncbi:MAG: chemotaxis protein CheA, partial [Verrucomicrobiota bacterium]